MKIAFVGTSKLPEKLESKVVQVVGLFVNGNEDIIISGGAKGVDTVVERFADYAEIPKLIFKPEIELWEGGYKQRNLKIVEECEMLVNIVVNSKNYCYHHGTNDHDRSGGCWTALMAKKEGKFSQTIILRNKE